MLTVRGLLRCALFDFPAGLGGLSMCAFRDNQLRAQMPFALRSRAYAAAQHIVPLRRYRGTCVRAVSARTGSYRVHIDLYGNMKMFVKS